MTDSRDATPMPNRRTMLVATLLSLAPGRPAAQETRVDPAIFSLIDAIAELRRQSSAAQARAEVRRLALELPAAPMGWSSGILNGSTRSPRPM